MLLRFGLPLLAMAAVVYFLRRLDKRWQEEGRQRMANMVMLAPQTPCWEVHNCQNKEQCLAFANPGTPCWQQFRSEEGMLKENCLGCSVFRNAPVPVKA
jgi:hypothetical protein